MFSTVHGLCWRIRDQAFWVETGALKQLEESGTLFLTSSTAASDAPGFQNPER